MWLGQAHALVNRWNNLEAISFKSSCDMLTMELVRDNNIAQILGILHRAIADLELSIPDKGQVAFAAGEVYEFTRELNKVIESADSRIYIIDPYLDHTVFDHYLISKKPDVTVRLLIKENIADVKAATDKYNQQHNNIIEVKSSNKIHDRVIFIDDYVCWVVGQSLKNAAKAKTTYLVPLAPDIVTEKLNDYETIWNEANAI